METLAIPQDLIAEEVNGTPYYYKGYQKVLNGQKNAEELMRSSYIQSRIVSRLLRFLRRCLDDSFEVLTSEIGLHMGGGHNRACDIALFEKVQLAEISETEQYLALPPKVVIEVDIRFEAEEQHTDTDYLMQKTQDLLDFGVERVIWILTRSQKIYVAEPNKPWMVVDWYTPVYVLSHVSIILADILEG